MRHSSLRHFFKKQTWLFVLLVVAIAHLTTPFVLLYAAVIIDPTVNTGDTTHNGTINTVVFTSDQTGYAFFRESDGTCGYRKTNDGGTNWTTSTITVDSQTDCLRIAVWYDRWTPGNSTGTRIHVLTMDNSSDDLWYNNLDTASDTLATSTNMISVSAAQAGTFTANANIQAITVSTDGTIYAGIQDVGDSFVVRCSSNCASATSSWSEVGTNPFDLANDWLLLAPISNGNILAIRWDISADDVESQIWFNSSSSWAGAWTNIDTACNQNTTYDGSFGATINELNGNIFLAMGCDTQVLGTNDDIRTAIFYNSSSSWALTANALTNTSYGLTGVKLGLDSNSSNIYVVYSARTTPADASTTNIYYKVSTSSMSTWGPELGPLNSTATDIWGMRIDGLNDERIYATWIDGAGDSINGNTVADLTQTTYEQSDYKFFRNQNATSVGSEIATQNTSGTMPNIGTPFRLRMLVRVGGEGADIGRNIFKLQFATSTAGGCDTSFTGETYVDVATSTGAIQFYDNSSSTDGTVLSATSTDPVHGGETIVNQTYEEQNTFTNSIQKILGGEAGKWDFSLVHSSGSPMDVYCFRIVESDDSLLDSYTAIPEIEANAAPTVSTVTLNGNMSIALIEGTSTLISATTTVTDINGIDEFQIVRGKIYRSGVGENCIVNDNNCYNIASCSFTSCGGNSCDVSCNTFIRYHADPTDGGTTWDSEDWGAWIQVVDNSSSSAATTSSLNVELLTLLALDVTPTLAYGSLSPGSTTDPISFTVRTTSTGNTSIDIGVFGANMTNGVDTIAPSQQHFATSSIGYATSTALSTSTQTINLNIPKTLSTSTPATSTTYWGIGVPSPQGGGNYTGNNTFIGIVNSLPWP